MIRDFFLFVAPVVFFNVMEEQYYQHLMILIDSIMVLLFPFNMTELMEVKEKVEIESCIKNN